MYDAILVVSFGGPEGPDDVLPFLENVLRGKNVPRERMLEVQQHYLEFGGVSPINRQCRELIGAVEKELEQHGVDLPVYWGNRNWHPMLDETLAQMVKDGIRHALAFFTSSFSSYSGCRQYRENIADALVRVGAAELQIDKLRMPFNHPGFIEPQIELLKSGLAKLDESQRENCCLLFTAHSIPASMASQCDYEKQLIESSRLIAQGAGVTRWELTFQSRSGPPQQPWLEPDICDRIEELHAQDDPSAIVIQPVGFVSDHIEVLYDLDKEAKATCDRLGLACQRIPTVGTHPRYIKMIRELIVERLDPTVERLAMGQLPAHHDRCPETCCLYPRNLPIGTARSVLP